MTLANELYDAAELTGIARAEMEIAEDNGLAQWLPNEYILSNVATFTKGESGLVLDEARYRAYDAEPEIGGEERGAEAAIKLPAISRNQPVSEETTINLRSVSDDTLRVYVERALRRSVRSILARVNRQRAQVLVEGSAVVNQDNFRFSDDFGRDERLTTTATNLWDDPSVDRIGYLETLRDLYAEVNGVEPGSLLMHRRVASALQKGDQFAVQLANGSSRPGTTADVNAYLEAADLPPITVFNERTRTGTLLPNDRLLMLPAPVGINSPDATELGSTVWGLTATALAEGFNIEESELPGIVAGVYAPNRVPYIHEVMADSVNLPILKDANLSLSATVLSSGD